MNLLIAIGVWLASGMGAAPPPDTLMSVQMEPVVVTATRSARELERVPVPTSVVTAETMRMRGALRLSDVLEEETGLMLTVDHGTGVQLQGFDPAYTLILVDGEPVVGRTAGTLDLERLSLSGVDRVEIVRGPSSSLYGSEALAGVVNVITREPADRLSGSLSSRYESFGTTSLGGEVEGQVGVVGLRASVDRYGSAGYDLTPGTIGATSPRFTDYAFASVATAKLGSDTRLRLSGRFGLEEQRDRALVFQDGLEHTARSTAHRDEWSATARLQHRIAAGVRLSGKAYFSRYAADSELRSEVDRSRLGGSDFEQMYRKAELQVDAVPGISHLITGGAGYAGEAVRAERIRGDRRHASSGFAFLQHEFLMSSRVDLVTSGRIDLHTAYGAHFSPKVAALYHPFGALRIRGSVGSGFKAPTFQELYLDYTNPTVGYTVFGSIDASDLIRRAEDEGQIVRLLMSPAALEEVGPESSVAFNVGADFDPLRWLGMKVNLFHNEVRDLIDTAPIASKPNGQYIFTYFNLNRIFTRGIETELSVRPLRTIQASAGYVLLDARDRDVLDAIDAGTLYRRVDGRDRRVTRDDYGGLMNRSRHAVNVRLQYQARRHSASLRGTYRSRYGFGDLNGNLVLDDEGEYVSGYWLWHLTLTRELPYGVSFQVGAKNLFDHRDPARVPGLPGRILFAGVRLGV